MHLILTGILFQFLGISSTLFLILMEDEIKLCMQQNIIMNDIILSQGQFLIVSPISPSGPPVSYKRFL